MNHPIMRIWLPIALALLLTVPASGQMQFGQAKLDQLERLAVDAGFGLRRLDALRDLHNLGAEIRISGQHVELQLSDGHDVHKTMPDGSRGVIQAPIWKGMLDDLDLLQTLEPDRITVMSQRFGNEEFKKICQLESVSELVLANHAQEIDARAWKRLNQLPQLKWYADNSDAADDELLAVLAGLPALEQISIGYGTFSAEGIGQLQQSATLNNVTLSNCQLDDDSFRELCLIPGLKQLALHGVQGISGEGFQSIVEARDLSAYTFTGTQDASGKFSIVDGAIEALSKLRNIDGICLWRTQLDDELFEELLASWESGPRQQLDSKKSLYLMETRITDRSVDAILASPHIDFDSAFVVLPRSVSVEAVKKLQTAHPDWAIVHPDIPVVSPAARSPDPNQE